ncbi:MAG: peptidylprolyl isomerase [Cellulosilyticaceae bacterium]
MTLKIKDYGIIKAELYPQIAPKTVENFTKLANGKFYDGLIFHRIISEFMIQGGCPDGMGTGGPGYSIEGEFSKNNFDNPIKHEVGVLSMARAFDYNSAGSQFFIVTKNSPHLDGMYAAFGKVVEGLDIVLEIENVLTDETDRPLVPVIIESIRVK